jgi:hypothetical protein
LERENRAVEETDGAKCLRKHKKIRMREDLLYRNFFPESWETGNKMKVNL